MNKLLLLVHYINGETMIIRIMVRAVLFYFLIIVSYKLMGKRELGELSLFDFVISTVLSQMIAMSIENYDDPILYTIAPLFILVLLQVVIRSLIDGKETLIINKGILNIKEMIKQRYSLDDLLTQLRDKNIRSIEEVDYAVLETNGKLSVFKKDDKDNNIFPLPLVLDGIIELDNLKLINKDKNWLLTILKDKNVELENVFYSFLNKNEVFIIKKN